MRGWLPKCLNNANICAKITSQNQTQHRLVCLDRPSSGQAKMGSLKVESSRFRPAAHNPLVIGSNPSPATKRALFSAFFI
jgi:hypothetical protein